MPMQTAITSVQMVSGRAMHLQMRNLSNLRGRSVASVLLQQIQTHKAFRLVQMASAEMPVFQGVNRIIFQMAKQLHFPMDLVTSEYSKTQ